MVVAPFCRAVKSADCLQIHEVPLIVAHRRNPGKEATTAHR